jgi:PhnB protein
MAPRGHRLQPPAFGATDAVRMPGPDGRIMHAQVRICDPAVMLVENRACGMLGPKAVGGSSVTIHLYVDDVDTVYQRAVAAGAKATMPSSDMFCGDR